MEIKSEVKSIFTVAKFIDFLAFFVGIYVGKLIMGYLPQFKMSNKINLFSKGNSRTYHFRLKPLTDYPHYIF